MPTTIVDDACSAKSAQNRAAHQSTHLFSSSTLCSSSAAAMVIIMAASASACDGMAAGCCCCCVGVGVWRCCGCCGKVCARLPTWVCCCGSSAPASGVWPDRNTARCYSCALEERVLSKEVSGRRLQITAGDFLYGSIVSAYKRLQNLHN